ncbi:hypothetical protein [Chitinophaga sp. S165]|uniref:hypothetical protein n=1 Tax=Chitinophaga sp. S165 TaxID=2135462 RepID=UPI000D70CBD0|nr:hypothetical protein [Chitinophaga sp. S165]
MISCLLLVLGAVAQIPSPSWDEWFKQKKTQKKYLITQIAELKVYLGLLEKGYRIAGDGLHLVHSIKNGEFGLHDLFYKSLSAVNPALRRHADVGTVAASQLLLVAKATALRKKASANPMLSASEKATITTTCGRIAHDALDVINQLEVAFASGTLSMTDDHRLSILETLRARSRKQWAFFQGYQSEASMAVQQKTREAVSAQVIKSRYGIQ